MKFETSTEISATTLEAVEKKLREAAIESKNDKFFGPDEKIELVVSPDAPSVAELARQASGSEDVTADPTVCAIAYTIAQRACNGDQTCLAIAAVAYQICLRS